MKLKKIKLSDFLFGAFILLLIIPQTRKPIQIALNKLKVSVWSPSKLDVEDQMKLEPFTYRLVDLKGQTNTITIGKGKPVFISYWATWCPPCIAELPSIQSLYNDYGDEVTFLLISNEELEIIDHFLKKKQFDLPVFKAQMATPEKLYDRSIPTNYVIDGEGKIIIKETGAADWNSDKVRALLDTLIKP